MTKTGKARLTVSVFVLAGAAVFALLASQLGGFSLAPSLRGSTVIDDATGLVKGARVTIAGVPVGTVTGLVPEGSKARVFLRIPTRLHLHQDCKTALRARSLLGEKYLAILPGSPAAPLLGKGFTIEAMPAPPAIEALLRKAAPLLDKLAGEEGNALIETIDSLNRIVPKIERVLDGLDTEELTRTATLAREMLEENRPSLKRAVASLGSLAHAATESRTRIEESLAAVKRLADDLDKAASEKNRAALTETLDRLPSTLRRLDEALTTLEKLDPLLKRLNAIDREDLHQFLQQEGVRIRFGKLDDR